MAPHTIPVGDISIGQAVEMELPMFDPFAFLPALTPEVLEENRAWLQPRALDPETGMFVLRIQSYVVRTPQRAVIAAMKAMPTDDDAYGKESIRPDGRMLHDFHLFQVKAPKESRGEWDVYNLLLTIPAEQAFKPMSPGACAFVPS